MHNQSKLSFCQTTILDMQQEFDEQRLFCEIQRDVQNSHTAKLPR